MSSTLGSPERPGEFFKPYQEKRPEPEYDYDNPVLRLAQAVKGFGPCEKCEVREPLYKSDSLHDPEKIVMSARRILGSEFAVNLEDENGNKYLVCKREAMFSDKLLH